ncbi:hypothetical protein CLAFUW4_11534 [Fulvia fulva]|uniref:Wax synthase domain-containing protein n=1 Tax=Passalora fulva TaxID=5499 RepID=A0A9Q8PD34_PASFU|nr:uncharacterized protein CLAFUR5_10577 [Fulvia fulva]KAK4619690.1 hypothetical protein CLAFUR4_11540 [Fulvia fulva]KAK4620655.1 hypothetical protein CLAFUR0_11548 [Fulvia fulva]UJO20254.1 hypothetical protein CLAFUR5_10577 [Fulvia fulva]WPV17427.1 hypothetical protein CLAFUW4_11534 [Fulvia fulva]WPV32133.1 hypothetical protein CLAFUW7_11539 [Fulvia fulva]
MALAHLQYAYLELVTTIVPGPQSITYFLPLILLITGLSVPQEVLSHNLLAALIVPVSIASTIHAWLMMGSLDVVSVDTLWWTLFFLVFRDPRKDFRRIVEAGGGEVDHKDGRIAKPKNRFPEIKEQGYPKDFLSRLQWVLPLTQERPLTSWKTGEASHDAKVLSPYITQSRWTFIRSILVVLLPALAITMPLALQLKANDLFFSAAGQFLDMPLVAADNNTPTIVAILQHSLPRQLLRPLTLGLYLYSLMILLFLPPFLLPVILTFLAPSGSTAHWSPHNWPQPHLGPFSAVLDHGLRGLWGKWWHQQMRHAVSEPGRWLSAKLHLCKNGLPRYAMICCSAFLLSGLTHAGLVPAELRWAELYQPWELRLRFAAFFWIQPVGILAEATLVEPMLRRLSGSAANLFRYLAVRVMRLCWVVLFMCLALTFLHDPFIELGYWKIWPPALLPANAQSMLRGDWLP